MLRVSSLLAAGIATAGAVASAQTVFVWEGGSSTAWANAANWDLGAMPGNGDIARFENHTARDPSIGGTSRTIGRLEFLAGSDAETIGGNSNLTIEGIFGIGIVNSSGVAHAFSPSVTLADSQSWNTSGSGSALAFNRPIDLGAHTLTIDSGVDTTISVSTGNSDTISGAGAIVKNGAGTLAFGANAANTFSGGVVINAGAVTFGGNSVFGAGTLTLAGGSLSSPGTGTRTLANDLALDGAATISGASGRHYRFASDNITASGGSLSINNSSGSGATSAGFSGSGFTVAADLDVGAFSELRLLNSTGTQTFSGTLSGSGLLRRNAAGGATLLAGNNSFSGGVILDAGTIVATHDNALGTGTLDLSGGTLHADSSRTFANAVTVSGISTIAGGAGVEFTFSSDSVAGTGGNITLDNTADSGAMSARFSGSGFTFSRPIVLSDAFTSLRFANASGTQTFTAQISGSGALVRETAGGTTVLSANNSFTGGVTLQAGEIGIGSNSALGAGTLTLAGGVLFASGGARAVANALEFTGDAEVAGGFNLAFNGGVAATGDRTLTITNTGVTTFGVNSIVLADVNQSRTLTLDVDEASGGVTINGTIADGAGSGADGLAKTGGGSLTLNAANTYTGATTVAAGRVIIGNNAAFGAGELVLAGGDLAYTADRTLANNLTLAADATLFADAGDDLVFSSDTIATTAGTLTLDNNATGLMSAGFSGAGFDFSRPIAFADEYTELRFLNTSGTQTFSGTISGAGALRQDGAGGAVVLAGENTYSGLTNIDAGTLRLGASGNDIASALGSSASGTVVANGATLDLNGFSVTTGEALRIRGAGEGGLGALINSGGAASFDGAITLSGATTIGGTGDIALEGTIGGTTTLTKIGASVLTLAGESTHSGDIVVSLGTLRLGAAGTGSATPLGTTEGDTTIEDGAALDLAGFTLATDESLTLAGAGPVDGALTNSGGAASYSGDITLSAAATIGGTGDIVLTGAIDGAATLTKSGSNTLTLEGNNSGFSGAIAITSGTLEAAHNEALGSGSAGATVSAGAALALTGGIILEVPLLLNGDGQLGTGALMNLSGNNTVSGLVTLESDSLIAAANGTFLSLSGEASVSGALQAGASTLTIGTASQAGDVVISADIASTGALVKNGAGSLFISDATDDLTATFGTIDLNAGTLVLGEGTQTAILATGALAAAGGTTLAIATGATLTATYAADTTTYFSGALTGMGEFVKAGDGELVFDQSFSAPNLTLTLAGGTLSLLGGTFAFGTINITGDTILDFNGSPGTVLTSANLAIAPGVSVTVNNWVSVANHALASTIWFATGSINGNAIGDMAEHTPPLNQVGFSGFEDRTTVWAPGDHSGWFSHEIRPTPEPAHYGATLLSGLFLLYCWRGRRAAGGPGRATR